MIHAKVTVEGGDEIARQLRLLSTATERRVLRSALDAAISVLGNAIRARTPVETGLLRESVGIYTHVDTSGESGYSVAGFGRQGYIARFVEFGHRMVGHKPGKKELGHVPAHPFVRPAFDSKAGKAMDTFVEKIRAAIDRALAKR